MMYVVGRPGSGKTVLTSEFLKQFERIERHAGPIKHETYSVPGQRRVIHIGWSDSGTVHGGTDMLPNSAINTVIPWLETLLPSDIVVAEGDRLASKRFFDAQRARGKLIVVFVDTPNEVANARQAARAQRHGTKLPALSWTKARITKTANIVAANPDCCRIDGTWPIAQQLEQLNQAFVGLQAP